MPEYLTPEQVEEWITANEQYDNDSGWYPYGRTLRELFEIAGAVASIREEDLYPVDYCWFCESDPHAPDCLWLRARKARGYADGNITP